MISLTFQCHNCRASDSGAKVYSISMEGFDSTRPKVQFQLMCSRCYSKYVEPAMAQEEQHPLAAERYMVKVESCTQEEFQEGPVWTSVVARQCCRACFNALSFLGAERNLILGNN